MVEEKLKDTELALGFARLKKDVAGLIAGLNEPLAAMWESNNYFCRLQKITAKLNDPEALLTTDELQFLEDHRESSSKGGKAGGKEAGKITKDRFDAARNGTISVEDKTKLENNYLYRLQEITAKRNNPESALTKEELLFLEAHRFAAAKGGNVIAARFALMEEALLSVA